MAVQEVFIFKFFFKIFLLAHLLCCVVRVFILCMLTALCGDSTFLLGAHTTQPECIFLLGTLTTLPKGSFLFCFDILHQMKIFLLDTLTVLSDKRIFLLTLSEDSFTLWHTHCTA